MKRDCSLKCKIYVRSCGQYIFAEQDQTLLEPLNGTEFLWLIRHLNGSIQDVVVAVYCLLTRGDELGGFFGDPFNSSPRHHSFKQPLP